MDKLHFFLPPVGVVEELNITVEQIYNPQGEVWGFKAFKDGTRITVHEVIEDLHLHWAYGDGLNPAIQGYATDLGIWGQVLMGYSVAPPVVEPLSLDVVIGTFKLGVYGFYEHDGFNWAVITSLGVVFPAQDFDDVLSIIEDLCADSP